MVVEHRRHLVDHRRQPLLLPERADASPHVAGDALGDVRIAHLDVLGAERPADRLERELAADRHDRDRLGAVGGDEQGLEHLIGVEAELVGRLDAEVVQRLTALVLVHA